MLYRSKQGVVHMHSHPAVRMAASHVPPAPRRNLCSTAGHSAHRETVPGHGRKGGCCRETLALLLPGPANRPHGLQLDQWQCGPCVACPARRPWVLPPQQAVSTPAKGGSRQGSVALPPMPGCRQLAGREAPLPPQGAGRKRCNTQQAKPERDGEAGRAGDMEVRTAAQQTRDVAQNPFSWSPTQSQSSPWWPGPPALPLPLASGHGSPTAS